MDQFGVLVESIGFKAYGKSSAPLADLKTSNNNINKSNATTSNSSNSNGFPQNIGVNQSSNSDFDFDVMFGSGNNKKFPNPEFDDVFGGFKGSASGSGLNNYDDVDDVFGLMKTSSGSGSGFGGNYDVLGNKVVSPVMQTDSVDDLLGGFGGMGVKGDNGGGKKASGLNFDGLTRNFNANAMKSGGVKKSSVRKQEADSEPDDLLSGFGSSLNGGLKKNSVKKQEAVSEPADLLSDFSVKSFSLNGRKSEANPSVRSAKSFSASAEDPFVMFETTQGSGYQVNNGASVDDYLDSLFSSGAPSNTRSSQSSTTEDSVYNALFNNNVAPKKQNKASSVSSNNTKQAMPKAKSTDDFSYLFGMGVAPPSGEFQEIEGESEERRKARFNHHMTTQARMNNALYEKNKRDLQAQQEQDEKHRVAATLEGDIKRWAVGKEGNLRALLSSLQHILWAGSGWQPISLTDLITSTAVKKAYYKATLCVHPDKVQQKGASVQQKYIAEKVFDLLKESWNKFNAEEFKKQ